MKLLISSLKKVNKEIAISLLKYIFMLPIGCIFRTLSKETWIITERPDQARDNGFCLFEYIRKEHPERQVYYIIDKAAGDYRKIAKYGNVIQYGSLEHYLYYFRSKVHISAHVGGCCPPFAPFTRYFRKVLGIKNVFVPHGVSYGVSDFCLKKYGNIDLFICSGKLEYENVLKNYGYTKKEVAYTGFPRLDKWHDIKVNKKQIVLMPTWRMYIAQNEEVDFITTDYYRRYQELLFDNRLNSFLEEHELQLVFYLHHNMQKYASFFRKASDNISIATVDDEYDIQELLKSAALLITDYSSVHFDFAYMKKPVLYYQFDKDEFLSRQYGAGIFDVYRDGFGEVVFEENDLVDRVIEAYNLDFKQISKYYKRMRVFYQKYDQKNCERVYRKITKLSHA